MKQIINSILQTDLYKLTMQQAIFHQYPFNNARYEFRCRDDIKLGYLAEQVREQVNLLGNLRLEKDEADYLRTLPFMSEDYVQWLQNMVIHPELVDIQNINDDLVINVKGKWVETILFEVYILAIVNELHFKEKTIYLSELNVLNKGKELLDAKIELIKQHPRLLIAEFGTRRRFSSEWQNYVFKELNKLPNVVGTSNVYLAKKYNTKPIGTMAHEYICAHLALVDNIQAAQKRALHVWLQEYGTNLGTALSDTFTSDVFFRDFGVVLANAFSGVRHDSGDPFEFGEKTIKHYESLGIDPRTKTIVFSDGLDIPLAIKLFDKFTGLINLSFGIGTNLTNDLGFRPLSIVMKLTEINGKPVVKISDNPAKAIGDPDMVKRVINGLDIKL